MNDLSASSQIIHQAVLVRPGVVRDAEVHEQRLRLEFEGVRFRGKRVDMAEHQHVFRTWEL